MSKDNDHKRNNDFDDFFDSTNEKNEKEQDTDTTNHNPYHYYSYGTNKQSSPNESGQQASEPVHQVEVSEPVRSFAPKTSTNWSAPKKKKRSSFKLGFLMFIIGALAMGTIAYGADKGNWFSDAPSTVASSQDSGQHDVQKPVIDSSQSNNTLKNTNLTDVVRPNNIAQIFESASPAVVKIETFVQASSLPNRGGSFFNDPFFRQFFGDQFGQTPQQTPRDDKDGGLQQSGMGSGFFFEKDGYILTNQHVIAGADEIRVTVQGYDKPLVAELLGNEFSLDLAVLKVEGDNFPYLELGDVNELNIGDWVVAIGNPYGFDHTVTVGVLSAKERPINIPDQQEQDIRRYEHLLQTDASINPGNSGGPLLNLAGEVIGINTAVSTQAQGIGFAIPTSTITDVLSNLKNNIKQPKPYIGIYMADIEEAWLNELELENTDGVLVSSTIQGSPAQMAGIQPYDVILEIDGEKIKDREQLANIVKSKKVGDRLELKISRDGEIVNSAIKVGDQNNQ